MRERANTPKALGDAIKRRRKELGLTQDDLALSIGVNRRVIGRLERGTENVRLVIALSAAQALGLNVEVEPRDEAGA